MYLPTFGGCSSLIHIIAQHWKISLALGVLGTVAYVSTSVGPGNHLGSDTALARYEQDVLKKNPLLVQQAEEVDAAFQELKNVPLSDINIRYILGACEKCTDISVDSVKKDQKLQEEVARIYFADLVQRNGLRKARLIYRELQH